ncbi:MAG: tRNA preQ1(34) S-adenosylmethionine ribosyltransferase-isomerase QueA [Steroidobacteraceae bacterium]
MRREDFHFELPAELIAQRPAAERSASRLLALDGASGAYRDFAIRDLPQLLTPGDLLIFNDTRVIPARVFGQKSSGGRIELLLERVLSRSTALVHARSSKPLRPEGSIALPGGHSARLLGREDALLELEFSCDVLAFFEAHGAMPLPPYITRAPEVFDRDRYQTIYARAPGAVAAPTAGLHFDAALFAALEARGIRHGFVTLHVGAGTFQPLRVDEIDAHVMHPETVSVPASTCEAIEAARAAGGRVIAVGTTVVRSLEAAATGGKLAPFEGQTRIFIKPGYRFAAVDAIVTNFHLPESTLLMLCSAFVGREPLLAAYRHAVAARYRFFSYGDAMFLTPAADSLRRP